ncbi:MAG TPA: glycosyltransferase family 4 protein [Ignavibacteriales bacterium]|nr:glycosyltransferase family 4 protein [Ignavibacteriales bacterium]
MNVLHLHTKLNKVCGITRVLKCIFENPLDDIKLFGLFEGGDNFEYFIELNKNISLFKTKNLLTRMWEIYKFTKKNKIDIIHSHHRYYDLLAFFVKKLNPKIKTVITAHYHSYDKKLFSYKADKIISVSDKIKETIVKNYSIKASKIITIYNPVDKTIQKIETPKEILLKELEIKQEDFTIGYVGRFKYDVKNLEIITSKINEILQIADNIKFLFVGNGDDLSLLQNEVKDYKEKVKIIISPKNLGDFYNLLDVIIVPSYIESFGLTTLEAGLFKKVILANSNSAVSEYLLHGKNVMLFNDSKDLITKIKIVYSDKLLRESLANNLYNYVLENHKPEDYIVKLKEVYLDLLINSFNNKYI